MASKSVQHWMLSDESKVAAERRKQRDAIAQMLQCTVVTGGQRTTMILPVVPWMASAERNVLHLEEVTTSVILKRGRKQNLSTDEFLMQDYF